MNSRLSTRTINKVWGRQPLPAPFGVAGQSEPIGEIWFEPDECLSDVLVKYLFTSDKLSVQVHPPASASPTGRGKEECWLVLEADPGAKLALGFREPVSREEMHSAALDGSIEKLLDWHEAVPGDFFYIPAGTVHAIGGGLTLIEVQENSDITYRFFDYGRPRDLHLDQALAVAIGDSHPPKYKCRIEPGEEAILVDGPRFVLAQITGDPSAAIIEKFGAAVQIMPLSGTAAIAGREIQPGASACAQSIEDVSFSADARCLIVSSMM